MDISGLKRRGLMYVLSSPSGAGKTTITRALLKNNSDSMKISVSATTRTRRAGEVQAQDYFFTDIAEFNELVENGDMLEHAKVFGHYYYLPIYPILHPAISPIRVNIKRCYLG